MSVERIVKQKLQEALGTTFLAVPVDALSAPNAITNKPILLNVDSKDLNRYAQEVYVKVTELNVNLIKSFIFYKDVNQIRITPHDRANLIPILDKFKQSPIMPELLSFTVKLEDLVVDLFAYKFKIGSHSFKVIINHKKAFLTGDSIMIPYVVKQ
jgi:hypothetical protein